MRRRIPKEVCQRRRVPVALEWVPGEEREQLKVVVVVVAAVCTCSMVSVVSEELRLRLRPIVSCIGLIVVYDIACQVMRSTDR